MALTHAMTWMPDKARWRKIYGGRLYHITCSALGCPATKDGSAAAANSWWRAKLAELHAAEVASHPHAGHLAELDRRRGWAESHGAEIETRNLANEIRRVRNGGEPGDEQAVLAEIVRMAGLGEVPDLDRLRDLLGTGARWEGRLGDPAPTDRTIGYHIDRYVASHRARADAGDLSASEFDTIRRCLHLYRDWMGETTAVEAITAERWEAWWVHLVGSDRSVEYKKKLLRYARGFIAWLGEMGSTTPPPNLHSRRYRFGGGAVVVPVLETDAVKRLTDEAPGQLQLHLLLMLNCGMTQGDISDLRPSEVDWEGRRITRKRSKTEDHASVPTVRYPLWPLTWRLLREYGRREGDRVLTTESGRPWVRDTINVDGKRSKTDAIKSNYVHLARRMKIGTPMKLLRKTSASLLETHETYGRYAPLFLGHAPRTVADRHYVRPSQDLFDQAVAWLGEQYGLAAG